MSRPDGHRQLRILAPAASPAEAAAIVAALERFMQETAPRRLAQPQAADAWRRTAILEGVSRAGFSVPGWER